MKRRISALFLLVTFVGGQVALAEQDPRTGRFLQRDPHYTGAPIINDTTFHGRAPMVDLPQPTPRLHYLNGMNIYQYVGSNPVNRNDPLGLFFFGGGYADVLTTAYWEADLRASDVARVGIAAMFLTAMLGSMITANQWGVTGGMSGAGFDVFLEGVDAAMSGAHALGESLMQSATTMTVLAVYSVSQSEAGLLPQN